MKVQTVFDLLLTFLLTNDITAVMFSWFKEVQTLVLLKEFRWSRLQMMLNCKIEQDCHMRSEKQMNSGTNNTSPCYLSIIFCWIECQKSLVALNCERRRRRAQFKVRDRLFLCMICCLLISNYDWLASRLHTTATQQQQQLAEEKSTNRAAIKIHDLMIL